MYDVILEELDKKYPDKPFVSSQEIAQFLGCEVRVVYNWMKRADPKRRPPALPVGKELRFAKKLIAQFLFGELNSQE